MSVIDIEGLASLLADYFHLRGGGPARDELLARLAAIASLADLISVDQDPENPLWSVVPQVALHRFGLKTFQELEPRHAAGRSFVFIHPAHRHVVSPLRDALRERGLVGVESTRVLTPQLINVLYGGYRWHSAYVGGCKLRGDIGQLATILLLPDCDHGALRELIKFKNAFRSSLAEKIVVPAKHLGEPMGAVIQAFHCPDVIENARQLLGLGLVDLTVDLE